LGEKFLEELRKTWDELVRAVELTTQKSEPTPSSQTTQTESNNE
jgi:hypothetical protein